MHRLFSLLEAWVFLDTPPSPVYLFEYFQGVAYEDYDYEDKGEKFVLTLIQEDSSQELTFEKTVSPDMLLASLQKYARKVSES